MSTEPTFRAVGTNGITLHVAEAGPEDGPLTILLHGFPEFWYGWRHQIAPLAGAGLRVLAPDQRGYNLSDKPRGVASYRLDELAADIVGLIEVQGRRSARLVGHDWGGIVAWWVAARHPERVERLAILNAPHPQVVFRHLLVSPRQWLKSWYVFAFQTPWLPEKLLSRRDWAFLCETMRRTSRPGTFDDRDFEHYRAAWSQPGAIATMIHWYRASMRRPPWGPPAPIEPPTLVLWGANDHFLERSVADRSLARCRDGRLEVLESATHWLHHEEPEKVNAHLIDFLMRASGTPPSPGAPGERTGAAGPGT